MCEWHAVKEKPLRSDFPTFMFWFAFRRMRTNLKVPNERSMAQEGNILAYRSTMEFEEFMHTDLIRKFEWNACNAVQKPNDGETQWLKWLWSVKMSLTFSKSNVLFVEQ